MAIDIVRLHNDGDKDFVDMAGSLPYRCPPGESIIIPWAAMCLWFGDPSISDIPELSKYERKDEVDRIRTRLGHKVKELAGEPVENPKIRFTTLEGNPIHTALDDPDGQKSGAWAAKTGNVTDAEAVAHELEQVKRQQAILLEQLNRLQSQGAAAPPSLDDIPDDVPTKLPVSIE